MVPWNHFNGNNNYNRYALALVLVCFHFIIVVSLVRLCEVHFVDFGCIAYRIGRGRGRSRGIGVWYEHQSMPMTDDSVCESNVLLHLCRIDRTMDERVDFKGSLFCVSVLLLSSPPPFVLFNNFFPDFCSCFFSLLLMLFLILKIFCLPDYTYTYMCMCAQSNERIKHFHFYNININTMRFMLGKALSTHDITPNRSTRTKPYDMFEMKWKEKKE